VDEYASYKTQKKEILFLLTPEKRLKSKILERENIKGTGSQHSGREGKKQN